MDTHPVDPHADRQTMLMYCRLLTQVHLHASAQKANDSCPYSGGRRCTAGNASFVVVIVAARRNRVLLLSLLVLQ